MKELLIRNFFFIFCWFICFPACVFAQGRSENYAIRNWNAQSFGLESSAIRGVTKSSDGILFIATLDGLVTFDGHQFSRYCNGALGKTEEIFDIYAEESGRIWLVTGKGIFSIFKDQCTHVIPLDRYLRVFFVEKSQNETILLLRGKAYSTKEGKVIEKTLLPNSYFTSGIYFQNDFIVEVDDSIVTGSKAHRTLFSSMPISYFLRKKGNGFYYTDGKRKLKTYNIPKKEDHYSEIINSIDHKEIGQGQGFFYALTNDYLLILDDVGEHKIPIDESFCVNRLSDIYKDEGIYWVSTETHGLYMIRQSPVRVVKGKNQFQKQISAIYKDNGRLLIGYNCGGLYSLENDSLIEVNYEGNKCVWSIARAEDRSLWLGTFNGGIVRISGNQQDTTYSFGAICKAMLSDSKGRMWIASELGVFRWQNDQVKKMLSHNVAANLIYECNDGRILIGTKGGFYEVNNENIEFVRLDMFGDFEVNVLSFCERSDGQMLIGSSHGLLIKTQEKIQRIPFNHESFLDKVYSIHQTDSQFILSTNKGLSMVEKFEFNKLLNDPNPYLENYSLALSDGSEIPGFHGGSQNTFVEIDKNTLAYASLDGLIILDKDIISGIQKYSTRITQVLAAGKVMKRDRFEVPFGQFPIEVCYSTPSYFGHGAKFEYRINEGNWQPVGENRSIYLANLVPGKYKIGIRSSLNNTEAVCFFSISPLWYQSWWFQAILIILGILIVVLVSSTIQRNIKRKEHKKRELNMKISELEIKAFQSQLKPHFVYNSLASIQSLFLSGNQVEANKYLINFSTLLRRVLEFSDKLLIPIGQELKTLELYLKLEKLQFGAGVTFFFEVDNQINTDIEMIPSCILQPFVENSIKHGVSKIKEQGIIRIKVLNRGENLEIQIIDNGPGYKPNEPKQNNHGDGNSSKGMKLIDDRLIVLKETLGLHVNVEILNLEDNQCTGTMVKLVYGKTTLNENCNN